MSLHVGIFAFSEPFQPALNFALYFGHKCREWRRYEEISGDCHRFLVWIWGRQSYSAIEAYHEDAFHPNPVPVHGKPKTDRSEALLASPG